MRFAAAGSCGLPSLEFAEGCFSLARDGFCGLVAVTGDFEDAGGGGGERGEGGGDGGPVDSSVNGGAIAGPEVLVLHVGVRGEGAVIVVDVDLGDAGAEEFDGGADSGSARIRS